MPLMTRFSITEAEREEASQWFTVRKGLRQAIPGEARRHLQRLSRSLWSSRFSPQPDQRYGDVLKEQRGAFICERGQMELPQHMAERLYSCFVTKTEQPEELRFTSGGYHFGGRWFCPGCGVLMHEEQPGAVRCPKCGRNIGKYLHQLVELHPHLRQ